MSTKENVNTLKDKREELNEDISKVSARLDILKAEQTAIIQKVEAYSTRSSSLAKTLLEKAEAELSAKKRDIAIDEEYKFCLEYHLKEVIKEISDLEKDPSSYIQEQSEHMISEFLNYVEKNLEEIGSKILKSYNIVEVTKLHEEQYCGSCEIPTGEMGIYDKHTQSFIVKSSDFCFENPLFSLDHDSHDYLTCDRTIWYCNYVLSFQATLLKTLKEKYKFDDVLKLTIEPKSFTLELV